MSQEPLSEIACTCRGGDTIVHASTCPRGKAIRARGLHPPDGDAILIARRGWRGNREAHRAAGSKGGSRTAQDRDHMAEIGRRGGKVISRDRGHMSELGRTKRRNSRQAE